jgi:hypothetical protein
MAKYPKILPSKYRYTFLKVSLYFPQSIVILSSEYRYTFPEVSLYFFQSIVILSGQLPCRYSDPQK